MESISVKSACSRRLRHPGHLDVFLGIEPAQKSTVAIIEKPLQDFPLALLQLDRGVAGPEAALLERAVHDLAGPHARRADLLQEPANPFGHIARTALRKVQRVVVGRPGLQQLAERL